MLKNWKTLSDEDIKKHFLDWSKKYREQLAQLKENLIVQVSKQPFLSLEDIERFKQEFLQKSNQQLEKAIDKKYTKNTLQQVPKWVWLLMLFFAHDKILSWLWHPFFMFVLILSCVVFGYLAATNQLTVAINHVGWVVWFLLHRGSSLLKMSSNVSK